MIATWLTPAPPRRGRSSTIRGRPSRIRRRPSTIRRRPSTIRRRRASIAAAAALALALALLAALAAGAAADVATQIVERCERGESISGYTVKQYQSAQRKMSTETIEYGDCSEVIQQAELAADAHHGPAGGGQGREAGESPGVGATGATLQPTSAQQHILEATRQEHPAPVRLGGAGGGTVQPGVVHPDLASATSDLPTPVLAVIALVLAGLLLLAGKEIKARLTGEDQG